jgi:hypothetical protein
MGLNGKLFRRRSDNSFSLFAINTRLVSGSRMLLETISLRRNFRLLYHAPEAFLLDSLGPLAFASTELTEEMKFQLNCKLCMLPITT